MTMDERRFKEAAEAITAKPNTRYCDVCGQRFKPKTRRHRRCSDECRKEARRRYQRKWHKNMTEEQRLKKLSKHQRWIARKKAEDPNWRRPTYKKSRASRDKENARMRRKRLMNRLLNPPRRTCDICGKVFKPKDSRSKRCSDECRREHDRLRMQEARSS